MATFNDLLLTRQPRSCLLALSIGGIALLAFGARPATSLFRLPHLVWNASASAPIGLWYVDAGARVGRGDMVVATTPVSVRQMAARRRYLPANVTLLKRIVAADGDAVCALGVKIFVNGVQVSNRRPNDHQGRRLPWWSGCLHLSAGQVLLMTKPRDSFDGRYFGPTSRAAIIGKARPLWLR